MVIIINIYLFILNNIIDNMVTGQLSTSSVRSSSQSINPKLYFTLSFLIAKMC